MVQTNLLFSDSEISNKSPSSMPCTVIAPSQIPTNGDCAKERRGEKEAVKRQSRRIAFL
jgi:hypothetical protein